MANPVVVRVPHHPTERHADAPAVPEKRKTAALRMNLAKAMPEVARFATKENDVSRPEYVMTDRIGSFLAAEPEQGRIAEGYHHERCIPALFIHIAVNAFRIRRVAEKGYLGVVRLEGFPGGALAKPQGDIGNSRP